jgi:hypothetical protein
MKLTTLGTALLMTTTTGLYAGEKLPKCFDSSRDGHCIAVQVNGQKTVRLTKKTKKMLEPLGASSLGGSGTRYEVPSPVRGALQLSADWVPEAVAYFGPQPEITVHVTPLEGQTLDTRPEISSAPSVQAGGSAAVTQADVVQGNRLPPGKYVRSVTANGSRRNWDRQTLFVQVVD